MNVALPALIVFVLLLPGFVFRDRIQRKEREVLDSAPFGRAVTEAIGWALLLHALWLGLAAVFRGQYLRLDLLLSLLSSNAVAQAQAIAAVSQRSDWVLQYFGSLTAAAFALPTAARWIVSRWRLDRIGHPLHRLFRFRGAPWYYLLTGADFRAEDVPDLIRISAIVDLAGTPYLYQGVLDEFFFSPSGELDRLVLQEVSRRPMLRERDLDDGLGPLVEEAPERFYPVDGDYFVLRYSEVITLNVLYVKLAPGEPVAAA